MFMTGTMACRRKTYGCGGDAGLDVGAGYGAQPFVSLENGKLAGRVGCEEYGRSESGEVEAVGDRSVVSRCAQQRRDYNYGRGAEQTEQQRPAADYVGFERPAVGAVGQREIAHGAVADVELCGCGDECRAVDENRVQSDAHRSEPDGDQLRADHRACDVDGLG